MKQTLAPCIKYEHKFIVPPSKTVPALYPESEEFLAMPEVFATGFLVGFLKGPNQRNQSNQRGQGQLNLESSADPP